MESPSRVLPIVVGYDGSEPSEAALQWAAHAADHRGLSLVVMHAAERITYTQDAGSGLWKTEEVFAEAKEVAQHGKDKVLEHYPDVNVETAGSLFSAKVALGEASTHASMMVLGSHGRGRIGTLLLGSTAYSIAAYARCPVVVVRDAASELPGPQRPVVVGINGHGGSEGALEAAVAMASDWSAPLVLVTTWAPAPPDPWDKGPVGYNSTAEATADYRSTAERVNATALERVSSRHSDLDVEGKVLQGHAVDCLIEAANEGGLLVLGTRGHGPLAGAALGATSLEVLHRATSPIMIVD
ncbi:MAG: universal stress protein [Ornithinimicrobium sp.]